MASCISVAATGGGGSDKGAAESDWSEAPRLGEDGEENEEDDGNAGEAAMESGSPGGSVRRNASHIAANCPPEDEEVDEDDEEEDDESPPPP
jgi:hypothetical protein